MKTNTYLTVTTLLFASFIMVGFAQPAFAQSRLVSMQTDSFDVNYESFQALTTGAPESYSQALSWTSFGEFMKAVFQIVIGAVGIILAYVIIARLSAHYKKRKIKIRIHSHSLIARHYRT